MINALPFGVWSGADVDGVHDIGEQMIMTTCYDGLRLAWEVCMGAPRPGADRYERMGFYGTKYNQRNAYLAQVQMAACQAFAVGVSLELLNSNRCAS